VFNLEASENEQFDIYRSHPDKLLRVHLNGVMAGVSGRTNLPLALISALFHDLGKLNPNFQIKLDDAETSDYSSHAYLSAHSFLCFCATNRSILPPIGIMSEADIFSAVNIIAHHHGDLADIKSILRASEINLMANFVKSQTNLPVSTCLQKYVQHDDFAVNEHQLQKLLPKFSIMPDCILDKVGDKLTFFLKTQFSFACLIEADKRDAGNNKWFNKNEQLEWAKNNFSESIFSTFKNLKSESELNYVRTEIRNEAVQNAKSALAQGERIFSLTAPTGSGKTFTLLAIADAIREKNVNHSIIYSLPFLSITEQVDDLCRNTVFNGNPKFVTRIDSRSENPQLENLLKDLENAPEKINELLNISFSLETFDAAFIVTTFVQFFETLLSNRGATLLRLPNFSKCIFLIDELQALPPRLYVFFTAFLHKFCEMFDSYAVLSTATMPALSLPNVVTDKDRNPKLLFSEYKTPSELLSFEKFYTNPVFDRYCIEPLARTRPKCSLSGLAEKIKKTKLSSLIILNTIDDTLNLYKLLYQSFKEDVCVILLNTRFILDDRRKKIEICKQRLADSKQTILISTQLIEAGVDIDFPVVYRDLCPLPNLIQSAGRCNRNNKLKNGGIVCFFELIDDDGKSCAEKVYRDQADHYILDFSRRIISAPIPESGLLKIQKEFFDFVNSKMRIGDHPLEIDHHKKTDNLIKQINEEAFATIGTFRLIDKKYAGNEYQFYVPEGPRDRKWEDLESQIINIAKANSTSKGRLPFEEIKRYRLAIDEQLRSMSGRTVQVRAFYEDNLPPSERRNGSVKEICGIRKLCLPEIHYSSETGIQVNGTAVAII